MADLSPISPSAWEALDAETEWVFDWTLSLTAETTEISGKFSEDLDLFYTVDDMVNLFNYKY